MRRSLILILTLLFGLALTAVLIGRHFQHPAAAGVAPAAGKPLYWYDPMAPDQHFDHPGKSPFMDMQLVPKMPEPQGQRDAGGNGGAIAIDPRVTQNLGVRLAPAQPGSVARTVDAVGLVAVDEHRIEAVQVRAAGWVEQLAVRAAGDPVRRGQLLAGVYAPDLLAAQQEFLVALGSGDPALGGAARQRLALLGLSAAQIAQVEKTRQAARRVSYYAPFDGYVMELGARQGAALQPGTMLFQLADLASVWVTVQLPEAQAAWIKPGDAAQVELPALPGQPYAATVDYLYPELDTPTRTQKLRLVLRNPGQRLRPGMYASVHLAGAPRGGVLLVPSEAVIKTGTRSVVIVADDAGHFHPQAVRTGTEYRGQSEIVEGLAAGQQVVASGQFLIDSEANLRGALDSLAAAPAQASDVTNMQMPAPGQGQ